jgi:hypothetical protein
VTVNDKPAATGKPSLAVRIDEEKSHPLAWKTVAKRAAVVAVAGVAIYLVFPATSGMDTSSTVGGLAAFSLLGVGGARGTSASAA